MSILTRLSATKPPPATTPATSETAAPAEAKDTLHLTPRATPAPATSRHLASSGAAHGAPPLAKSAPFEHIVERYHGKVFQLIYRYTGDYEESCDLTQDTFVRAYAAWNEFRGESQIYTWLYRIAINLCHNQQKKNQRRRRVERVSLDTPVDSDNFEGWSMPEVADERPLPLQILESHELRVRLHEALRQLPDNYRTVIVLRDIEGLTYEEIARATDSTLEAIKSRLFRARNAVRRLLTPYLLAEGQGDLVEETASSESRSL